MQIFLAFLLFLFSSTYVLILYQLSSGPQVLQKILSVPLILIIIVFYHAGKNSWKIFTNPYDKWIFLCGITIFIQLLVLATNGLQSPFFILIHIVMIGTSLLFNFSVAILFLLSSLLIILIDMSFSQDLATLLSTNPTTTVLQLISLFSIVPLAYIVSEQYHTKEVIATFLKKKVDIDEAILSNLNEMIIVTDAQFRILSLNDAAARILQQSRSELLDKQLFTTLFLKDREGNLVTKETFSSFKTDEFILARSPIAERSVTVQAQPINQSEKQNSEICFIITYTHTNENIVTVPLDKARAKFEALLQNVKKQLLIQNSLNTRRDLMLLEKIEYDTYIFQSLQQAPKKADYNRSDIAQLCRQIARLDQEFANAFRVTTNFTLPHFGMDDVAPLTVKSYPVSPEQLTGPFFTVICDVNHVEMMIKKLFNLAIFLASTEDKSQVTLSVTGKTTNDVVVTITSNCPILDESELNDIFLPYYGRLEEKTNLHMGSGLEGSIAKQIADTLGLPVTLQYNKDSSEIELTLRIPKKPTDS